jgi:hypothetical protein
MVLFGPKRNVGPWRPSLRFVPVSKEEMAEQYELQNTQPGYVQLKQHTHVRCIARARERSRVMMLCCFGAVGPDKRQERGLRMSESKRSTV